MKYIVRKVIFYLIALWLAVTLNFAIPRLMPGDPASTMFAQAQGKMSSDQLRALKADLGYSNSSVVQQYFTYLWNIAHGNLGLSFSHFPVPVTTVIGQDLPWTLLLVGVAVLISSVLGTLLGIMAAWRRGSSFDNILPPLLLFLLSFPGFWLGLALIYLLAMRLGWFPLGHAYNLDVNPEWSWPFIGSVIGHAALPPLVLVLTTLG